MAKIGYWLFVCFWFYAMFQYFKEQIHLLAKDTTRNKWHTILSFVIYIILFIVLNFTSSSFNIAVMLPAGITLIIGVLKEIYDTKHNGIFDIHDIERDVTGILYGILVVVMYELIVMGVI